MAVTLTCFPYPRTPISAFAEVPCVVRLVISLTGIELLYAISPTLKWVPMTSKNMSRGQWRNIHLTVARHTAIQPGVWSGVPLHLILVIGTPLVAIRCTLTAERYVDNILCPIVLLFFSCTPELHFSGIIPGHTCCHFY